MTLEVQDILWNVKKSDFLDKSENSVSNLPLLRINSKYLRQSWNVEN